MIAIRLTWRIKKLWQCIDESPQLSGWIAPMEADFNSALQIAKSFSVLLKSADYIQNHSRLYDHGPDNATLGLKSNCYSSNLLMLNWTIAMSRTLSDIRHRMSSTQIRISSESSIWKQKRLAKGNRTLAQWILKRFVRRHYSFARS